MMAFEKHKNNQSGEEGASEKVTSPEHASKQETGSTDEILMDYEDLAGAKGTPGTGEGLDTSIGLIGGQHTYDEGGLDISQYTGPKSRTSSQIDDPDAPYGTGPGNGLSQKTAGRP